MESTWNTATKKADLNFEEFFFPLLMWLHNAACISVWKLQNSKHFNLVQKTSRYLECNKSYDRLHPGTPAHNSSQIPVGVQGFVGSPPHPGCIMTYSYHQMCPALNSNHTEVINRLPLGCCSDGQDSPGNCLVVCGDRTFFQLNFRVQPMPEMYLERIAALLQHFVT